MTQKLICGVDEAGRGPLAGAVIAAAVILPEQYDLPELADSKKLTPLKREKLALKIKEQAIAWTLGRGEVEEIDRINILQASLLAMSRAINALTPQPEEAWIDGNKCPKGINVKASAFVKGDDRFPCISAASIIAKVARDQELMTLAEAYPQYGFERHKGYPTAAHMAALAEHGPSPVHRKSFKPVQNSLVLSEVE